MKVYFAHSMIHYGSGDEKIALMFLRKRFETVIDPNKDMGEQGDIVPYLAKITECDAVCVMEYEGFVGKGVFSEVKFALLCKKPVYAMRNNKLYIVKSVKVYDSTDWKIAYGKIKIGKEYLCKSTRV